MAEMGYSCIRTVCVFVCSVCKYVNEWLDPKIEPDCSLPHREIDLKLFVPAQTNPQPQPTRSYSIDWSLIGSEGGGGFEGFPVGHLAHMLGSSLF